MWYETKMLQETFDSIIAALSFSKVPTEIRLCFNSQTYLEKPITGKAEEMFDIVAEHPLMKKATIIRKTNDDAFYNIADWRRDQYNKNGYTFWGESDCLVPEEYFYVVESLKIDHPHYLSFASRKMWDPTWARVEHIDLRDLLCSPDRKQIEKPFHWDDYISFDTLCEINRKQREIEIIKLWAPKVDGSLLVLSKGLPKFIPDNMHFVCEDSCAQYSFEKYKIPQYLVSNILKGHNYKHPLKRTNTKASRSDKLYLKYKNEAVESAANFIDPWNKHTRKLKYGYLRLYAFRILNDILRTLHLKTIKYKYGRHILFIKSPHQLQT